jgi:chemotaxis regulatin CheY-phosphate phosphatase CheZ
MSTLLNLTDEDYLLIEDAIAANARGRAFLRMRDQRSRVVASDDVKRLVRSLTTSVKKAASPENEGGAHLRILRQELHDMSVCIQQTRSEVAALRPDESGNNRIMAATGELDAIVTATERATSEILNSAERIQALVSRMPRDSETKTIREELETQVTEILTACSFQDITGQRTTKVVNTLHYLEKRVNSMIEIWGPEALTALGAVERGDNRPDAHLLNGPSLQGVSQEDVDALLANLNSTAQPEPAAAPTPPATKATVPTTPKTKPTPAVAGKGEVNGVSAGHAAINQNDVDALFE